MTKTELARELINSGFVKEAEIEPIRKVGMNSKDGLGEL
jgi:hypothetical protein